MTKTATYSTFSTFTTRVHGDQIFYVVEKTEQHNEIRSTRPNGLVFIHHVGTAKYIRRCWKALVAEQAKRGHVAPPVLRSTKG